MTLHKLPGIYGDLMFPAGDPWTRATGESAKAYEGFTAYMNMGTERSLAKVARQSGKDVTLYQRWSARWHWVARTDASDRHEDRQYQIQREADRKEMDKRHSKLASAILSRVAQRILGVNTDALQVAALDPGKLTATDVGRLLDTASRLERLARGAPESTLGVQAVDQDGQATTSPLTLQILANPVARQKAYDLLASIAEDAEPAVEEEPEADAGMNGNEASA